MTHLPILALLVTSLYVAHLLHDSKKVKCTMVQYNAAEIPHCTHNFRSGWYALVTHILLWKI